MRFPVKTMSAHIKHTEDALRMIRQDLDRERLAHIARHGDDHGSGPDIFAGRAQFAERDGKLGFLMALAIVALGTCATAFAFRIL